MDIQTIKKNQDLILEHCEKALEHINNVGKQLQVNSICNKIGFCQVEINLAYEGVEKIKGIIQNELLDWVGL